MKVALRHAVAKLADAVAVEKAKPQPNWTGFVQRAFKSLDQNQWQAVVHANDLTFSNMLARAVVLRQAST